MGIWVEYCRICGAPLQNELYMFEDGDHDDLLAKFGNHAKYDWLNKVRVSFTNEILSYDLYGGFKDAKKKLVAVTMDYDGKTPVEEFPVHDACFKLNGHRVPTFKFPTDLNKYQAQDFDYEGLIKNTGLWKLWDPARSPENKKRIQKLIETANRRSSTASRVSALLKNVPMRDIRQICEMVPKPGLKPPAGWSRFTKDELIKKCREHYYNFSDAEFEEDINRFLAVAIRRQKTITINTLKKRLENKNAVPIKDMTVPELKNLCKELGISGYSRLTKAELIAKCSRKSKPKKSKPKSVTSKSKTTITVPELQRICREKGISGYSRKTKAELIKLCK